MKKLSCSNVAKLKLKTPAILFEYIERWRAACTGITTARTYFEYIDEVGGQLIQRVWSVKGYKKGDVKYAEIIRRGEDMLAKLCHCDYWTMSGYKANYDNPEWDPEEVWSWGNKDGKTTCWVWGEIMNKKQVLKEHDPHGSYKPETGMHLFKYLVKLKNEPGIEMLVKNGYGPLVGCTYMLNKKGRTIAEILKVEPKWVNYMKGKGRNELIACRCLYVKTEDEADYYAGMLSDPYYRKVLKYAGKYFMDLYFYVQSIGCHYATWYYEDYLRMAKEMGYPMNEKKVLFPRTIVEAHDKVAKEYKLMQEEEKNAQMRGWVEQLQKYCYQNEELFISPAANCSELKDESEQMENCVRSYADRYSQGVTAIFFIRRINQPDKSFVTLELKNKRVTQCFAKHNSEPDQQVKNFVAEWKGEYGFA